MLGSTPATLRIPDRVTKAPIILWHGFGPPASEAALMEALPLDDVAAVKVYLGLPLFGARTPADKADSLASRQAEDYGTRIFEPIVLGAAHELPSVVQALRTMKCLGPNDPVALFGFSAGGAAVLSALIERQMPVRAAVTFDAPVGLRTSIEALEHATHHSYAWTPRTLELADRSDAIGHASQIAASSPPPAVLLIHGADDVVVSPNGAIALNRALVPLYQHGGDERRLKLLIAPGVSHDWSDPATLRMLRAAVAQWFNRF